MLQGKEELEEKQVKQTKPEILAPAGSVEALRAAISGGADAVYMAGERFGARAFAKNFTDEELAKAVAYAHERGVKCYITVNTLITDREMEEAKQFISFLCKIGVDAVILQDAGLAALIAKWAPGLHRHASTQMAVHNLDGVRELAAQGFTRVVVARELSMKNLTTIVQNSPVEIEMFVHGSLCFSHSGQCLMSAVIGRRSANRGRCAGPCRLPCSIEGGKSRYQMSLKDLCLAEKIPELCKLGVASLKIEGRMKRPEYVSSVTRTYANAVRYGLKPVKEEINRMSEIFSRSGFTSGYYDDKIDREMFGKREEEDVTRAAATLEKERKKTEEGLLKEEVRKSPIQFEMIIKEGQPVTLKAYTLTGSATAVGEIPEKAIKRAITDEEVNRQLCKTGGTAYQVEEIRLDIDEGLAMPVSAINALRREVVEKLETLRLSAAEIPFAAEEELLQSIPKQEHRLVASFFRFGQIPENTDTLEAVFLPAAEILLREEEVKVLLSKNIVVGVTLPRVIMDDEKKALAALLKNCFDLGVTTAMCGNIGHLGMLKKIGFSLWGDIGLNIFNSYSIREYQHLGFERVLLSPELSSAQIRDMTKTLPSGIFAYGRLPLMVSENCLGKSGLGCSGRCKLPSVLHDRRGENFPVFPQPGCRSLILNSKILYLADKIEEIKETEAAFSFLYFTDENQDTCAQVISAYAGGMSAKPEEFTRGLFGKGVE